jgi:hypothetical protein
METETRQSAAEGPVMPWTPARAARLAVGGRGRFALALALTVGLLAGATAYVARVAWFPALEEAIAALPDRARIDDGWLIWPNADRMVLADNQWLALVVDPVARDPSVQAADVQIELTANACWISCLPGCLRLPYPPGYVIDLDRDTVESLWGAWRPWVQAGVFFAGGLLPAALAALIALLLAGPAKGYAWLLGRPAGWGAAWRLAFAAQIPGAWLLTLGLILYRFRALMPPLLLGVLALGGLVTGGFLLLAPWWLPRPETETAPPPSRDNPFADAESGEE